MYRLKIVRVGKARCKWAESAVSDYTKRLTRHGKITEVMVKPSLYRGDVDRVRAEEAARLLKQVGPRDPVVALDERGSALNSHDFATALEALNLQGTVVFLIGGAYGLDESVRTRANRTLRLSSMVYNHEVARVVLFEQLYRAVTLLKGIPYHH